MSDLSPKLKATSVFATVTPTYELDYQYKKEIAQYKARIEDYFNSHKPLFIDHDDSVMELFAIRNNIREDFYRLAKIYESIQFRCVDLEKRTKWIKIQANKEK